MEKKRNLTDDDAEAIACALAKELRKEFFSNIGRGVWALVWKGIIFVLIWLSVIGAGKSIMDISIK